MILAPLSPTDRAALRDLGELLCDCTRPGGRRDRARCRVRELVESLRSDCSVADAEAISCCLIFSADGREGAERLAEFALVEILAHELPWSWEASA
ncbi:MAG: hypothetical protein CTY36_02730 [Methylocystis sp.]|nr:MAG: hypothetical protein CTY36_02730 [Methylocystis sp.]